MWGSVWMDQVLLPSMGRVSYGPTMCRCWRWWWRGGTQDGCGELEVELPLLQQEEHPWWGSWYAMKHLHLEVFSNCPEVGRATAPICDRGNSTDNIRAGVTGALCWECCSHSMLAWSWGSCCGRCHHWCSTYVCCDVSFQTWFPVLLSCRSTYQLPSVSFRRKPLLIMPVGSQADQLLLCSHHLSHLHLTSTVGVKQLKIFS